MAKYVLSYHGGGMASTQEAQDAAMTAWGQWFGQLGPAIIDPGNPIMLMKTVGPDGSVSDGGGERPVTGYSLLEADSLDAAVALAKGCPVLAAGGSVEVGEAIDVGM